MLGVQLEDVGNLLEPRRGIGDEEVLVEGSGQERVVDPEKHVAEGVLLGQDGLIQHLSGIP